VVGGGHSHRRVSARHHTIGREERDYDYIGYSGPGEDPCPFPAGRPVEDDETVEAQPPRAGKNLDNLGFGVLPDVQHDELLLRPVGPETGEYFDVQL
jgi:hypothetical protein